jgi:hypothetical protein
MDERSKCSNGWLHRYKMIHATKDGVTEMCEICRDMKYFRTGVSNWSYLKYHLRSALQENHPYFKHEYASTETAN